MSAHNVIAAFKHFLAEQGLVPEQVVADGELHRCPTSTKPGKLNGAYVFHNDSPPSGYWENFETGESGTWTTPKVKTARKANHAPKPAPAENQDQESTIEQRASGVLHGSTEPNPEHPYLIKKGVPPLGTLRQHGENLVIPLYDGAGKITGLQIIEPQGNKRFIQGTRKKGAFAVIGTDKKGRLHICEGWATAASTHLATNGTVLVAFDCGNLLAVAQLARNLYPEREICIVADNDLNTEANPGLTKATQAARAIGAFLAVPSFQPGSAGTDANDMHLMHGLAALAELLAEAPLAGPPPDKPPAAQKPGTGRFILSDRGVTVLETDRHGNDYTVFVCSQLEAVEFARNMDGREWSKTFKITDTEGRAHLVNIPLRSLAGDGEQYRAMLLSHGLVINPSSKGKELLTEYILQAKPDEITTSVDKVGWVGNDSFVLPDEIIGANPEKIKLQQAFNNIYQAGGCLAAWQASIGRIAAKNPLLAFSVALSFSAPLLELLGEEGGGFHLFGASSKGKTTALYAGASVWGRASEFINTWRATDNALEKIAMRHNDTLLCLDELGQSQGGVAAETAYMLANGQGKARATREGGARDVTTWKTLFLSSGEIPFYQKIEESGRRVMAGQLARVVDVDACQFRFGAFLDLAGEASPAQLAELIKLEANTNFGHPARAFLAYLTANPEKAREKALEVIGKQMNSCLRDADGQVKRVQKRFAIVAAAAALAIDAKVLPWNAAETLANIEAFFLSWIELRGGSGKAEEMALIEHVLDFLNRHGSSRFEPVHSDHAELTVHNRAGFKRVTQEEGITYYVFPETFRHELCLNLPYQEAVRILINNRILMTNTDGKTSSPVRIPRLNRVVRLIKLLPRGDAIDSNKGVTGVTAL